MGEYIQALKKERLSYLSISGEGDLVGVLGLTITRMQTNNPELVMYWHKLAVFAEPFDREAAAGIWGILTALVREVRDENGTGYTGKFEVIPAPEEKTRSVLSTLTRLSLLNYDAVTHRYTMHVLLQEYARRSENEKYLGENRKDLYARFCYYILDRGGKLAKRIREDKGDTLESLKELDLIWPIIKNAWNYQLQDDNMATQNWRAQFSIQLFSFLDLRIKTSERLDYYQNSAEAAKRLGYKRFEAMNLGYLGNTYFLIGKFHLALEYFQKTYEIHKDIGDEERMSLDVGNIGAAHTKLGNLEKGIEYTLSALSFARRFGNHADECKWLANLVTLYKDKGDITLARETLEKALEVSQQVGQTKLEAGNLVKIAGFLKEEGQLEKSEKLYKQALGLANKTGDVQLTAMIHANIGQVCVERQQYLDAEHHFEIAYSISQEIENLYDALKFLNTLGNIRFLLGKRLEAVASFEHLFEAHQQNNECEEMLSVMEKMSTLYNELLQPEKRNHYIDLTIECYLAASSKCHQEGDFKGQVTCLINVGAIYEFGKNSDKAINYLEQALSLSREYDIKALEGMALINLGSLYLNLGRPVDARLNWEKALEIFLQLGTPEVDLVRKFLSSF